MSPYKKIAKQWGLFDRKPNSVRQSEYRARLRNKQMREILKQIEKLERKLLRLQTTQRKHLNVK